MSVHTWSLMPNGLSVRSWWIQYDSLDLLQLVVEALSISPLIRSMTVTSIAILAWFLALKWLAIGVSRECFMSARCSFSLTLRVLFVSPTYCFVHVLQVIKYTRLKSSQSCWCNICLVSYARFVYELLRRFFCYYQVTNVATFSYTWDMYVIYCPSLCPLCGWIGKGSSHQLVFYVGWFSVGCKGFI